MLSVSDGWIATIYSPGEWSVRVLATRRPRAGGIEPLEVRVTLSDTSRSARQARGGGVGMVEPHLPSSLRIGGGKTRLSAAAGEG